ncbi:hypothetical protein CXB51_001330 [Gossypium anomalum]|uniref:Reverse transcriptase Ty1/copia-type domain-containing protein n=1 Tax=Gossypium anomalum TaxID=47600 RepID=A0A8J5ZJH8_9ROSI|nr:hypothetical protein CXB51_001330 [Gossypium anomalum]
MLRTAEGNMKKVGPKPILMVRNNKGKRQAKVSTKPKGKGKPNLGKGKATLKPKGGVFKKGNYFHCGVTGHWKRNCPVYLEEIKKAKASGTSASDIYVIDINLSTTTSWVLDIGCGSHICTSVQGLQRSRTLARGDVDLRVGNGARVAALAVGTYTLSLPSGLGGAYLSLEFDDLLKECGIVSQLTPPGTPQWNGVSERRNETLLDMGCEAYVKRQTFTKLEPKSERCIFVGYPKETKGYYFFNPTENKVFVARTEIKQQQIPQEIEEQVTTVETQPLRRSLRERHALERYGFLITMHGDILLIDQDEPRTCQEAVASPDSKKWLEAMRSEMDSMYENQVWTLVDPPERVKPIGCKWVFKKKTDMDGNLQTYKGRLVAKSFRQIYGVDYDETFSPVAMFKSIRILLAIAAFHDYKIWQMDVKTAFLNGKLEEDVYMTQPEGFVDPKDAGKICKLQRSIYGLKQASRNWNLRFNDAIKEFGFIKNEDEPCV